MKQITYPALFFYDKEYNDYVVEFSDICIYAEGDTMEEAYKTAQDYLRAYFDCCAELNKSANPPSNCDELLKMHPEGKVMLVSIDYDDKKSKNEEEPTEKENYTNVNEDILEDITEYDKQNSIVEDHDDYEEKPVSRKHSDDGDGDDGDDGDFSLPEAE